jgi:hypothetical protein
MTQKAKVSMEHMTTIYGNRFINLREPLTDELVDIIVDDQVSILNVCEYHPWTARSIPRLADVIVNVSVGDNRTPLDFINHLSRLKKLSLQESSKAKISAIDFSNLRSVEELYIGMSSELPADLSVCDNLRTLEISGKVNVNNISKSIDQVDTLIISRAGDFGGRNLLSFFKGLKELRLSRSRCETLDLRDAAESITKLYIEFFPNCKDASSLSVLQSLNHIHLSDFKRLEDISALSDLKMLREVYLENFPLLQSIPPLSALENLKYLLFRSCPELTSLEPLLDCSGLEYLTLDGRTTVADGRLQFLINHPSLKGLSFDNRRHYDLNNKDISAMEEVLWKWLIERRAPCTERND